MAEDNTKVWQVNRQVSVSLFIQLVFLASLIVGSWVNLQRQLDLLQHDVRLILETQKAFGEKFESLQEKVVAHEYRLRAVEKAEDRGPKADARYRILDTLSFGRLRRGETAARRVRGSPSVLIRPVSTAGHGFC